MRKLLTIALAIACMAVLIGLAAAQGAQKNKQNSPPTSGATKPAPTTPPAPTAKNSAHATEQVMTGTVTKVNKEDKTFTLRMAVGIALSRSESTDLTNGKAVNFSAKNLKAPLPKVGDLVDVTYTQNPGEPPMATTVKSSKSNSSDRVTADTPKVMTGKVVTVNKEAKTFTLMSKGQLVTFSTKLLKSDTLLKVGSILDVTYTPGNHPGDPLCLEQSQLLEEQHLLA